jgi:hypothetical protein
LEAVVFAWDASLADRLDEVRVDASGPVTGFSESLVSVVRAYGFAVLDGVGGADAGRTDRRLVELGNALGTIVPQSPRGELIEDVRDVSDIEERDDRGYRSGGELAPHSDPPTLIVLHCVTAARSGGESHLVSVGAICQRLAVEHPAALDELRESFPMWRVEGQADRPAGPTEASHPVLSERDGVTSCVLYRPFIERAAEALGSPLTASQVAALDAFDLHSSDTSLTLRFTLTEGQTLVLHNRSVLHARTDYVDWPELDRRRHLRRLWIDAPELFPVDPAHELGDIFA